MSPGGGQVLPSTAEPQLVLRSGTNVWGKGGMSTNPPPQTQPPAVFTAQAITPAPYNESYPSTSSHSNNKSYNPTPEPEKPREMTEKERMAAALFGGIVPGAPAPPSGSTPSLSVPSLSHKIASKPAPTPAPKATPAPAPPPAPVPAPPPAPAIAMDLLDFSDPTPAPSSAAPAPSVAMMLDPFASAVEPLSSSTTFSYQNVPLVPLIYTTPQFGGEWGTLSSTSPISIVVSSSFSLDMLMTKYKSIGLHAVEAIPTTSEGIAAGKWSDKVILVHGKVDVSSGKVDFTVKCGNAELGAYFSSFLGKALVG